MDRPNVVLIVADQMRGDCMGVNGHPVVQTPNLDELATRGCNFTHAYTAVPSCIPARANLMTGQNQWHTGVLGMGKGQGPMPNDFPHTLAGEFTNAGYRTHMVGKGHFHPPRTLMGFESTELDESGRVPDSDHRTWFEGHAPDGVTPDDHGVDWNGWMARPWHTEEYLHPTAWTGMRACNFVDEHDYARPFFLNVSFARPHSPYVPPACYFDMYYRGETPHPYIAEWAPMHDIPDAPPRTTAWIGRMTPEQIHRARSGYLGSISFIDGQIGRFLGWYRRYHPEAYENTWFLFAADHGDMQGDHYMWRKTYAFEGSSHIPFILCPPRGRAKRHTAQEPVELQDVMPTLLGAAGLDIPKTVDGRSLVPLLNGPAADWRTYVHGEHCTCYSDSAEMQYVTDGLRKFIWYPRTDREQFFDLEQDPGEIHDLIDAPDRRNEIAKWRGYLTEVLEERDCGWVRNGRPHCPSDEPLVSPYQDKRYQGRG